MSNLDKINIFVPESINQILESDVRLFEILKKDHQTVNMNKYLSLLISGYYNTYMEDLRRRYTQIHTILMPILTNNINESDISETIQKIIYQTSSTDSREKKTKRLSLKPTSLTENIILQIINSTEIGGFVSPFLCHMISDYCMKPLDERERIVFSQTYSFILEACQNHQTISFSTIWNPTQLHTVFPYKIVTGQGEMFNYLLCQERDPNTSYPYARAYRLNRISKSNYSYPDVLDDTIQKRLDRMNLYGAQYIINDEEEACVFLSINGARLYNRIYYGRPAYSRIEETENGYKYYFYCSKDQLSFYFRRFSNGDAIILYPDSLVKDMIDFHKNALDYYTN